MNPASLYNGLELKNKYSKSCIFAIESVLLMRKSEDKLFGSNRSSTQSFLFKYMLHLMVFF